MKILFYCPFKFSIKNFYKNSWGGIETLNYDLASRLAKNHLFSVYLATHTKHKIKHKSLINLPINDALNKKYEFDVVISSNDAKIFNNFQNSKKIYWMHNTLAIEKAFRKKFFFPLILNKISTVFVSNYLKNITSKIYLFNNKIMIPNFLSENFKDIKRNYSRKKIFIWSVRRDKGLDNVLNIWISKIFPNNRDAKLFIYGLDKNLFKNKLSFFKKKNIYFFGIVDKNKLKTIYSKSLAMICLGYDETFCLNAIEANACGLPIITLGKTALKDFTHHKKNGYLVKDYNDLANQINTLCLSKPTRNIIKFCYQNSKNYLLKKVINKWIDLIKN